jgi:DNA invertase Pin-like site-specific DNA recombinase
LSDVGGVLADAEAAARELAVYLSYDADTAGKRGASDVAEQLRTRWRAAGALAEHLRSLNPDSVTAEPRTLAEVRALAEQLTYRLAGLVPEISATRRAVIASPAPAATLDRVERAVAYLRVSTARQAEGLGLEVQEAAIRLWARRHKVRISLVVRDEGRSGAADVIDRPGLAEALGHVEAGRAQAVVVARLDRIARDAILQEWIRAELVNRGAQLRSADEVEDVHLVAEPDNPTATLVRQILGAVSQYERAMIRLRMEAGKARKRDAGGYIGGQPRYGYRADGHDLVPNLEEQRQISRMRRWRREGKSLRDIADRLNDEGVPPARGDRWHPMTVGRVLDRASNRKAS